MSQGRGGCILIGYLSSRDMTPIMRYQCHIFVALKCIYMNANKIKVNSAKGVSPAGCQDQWWFMVHWNIVNPLAPGKSECNSKNGMFNLVLLIGIFRSSHDNVLRWMPHDLTDNQPTSVQVIAWCRQASTITWADVDSVPCRLMALLGHNDLIFVQSQCVKFIAICNNLSSCPVVYYYLWPLLLTWFNFNPSMDK